MTGERPGPPREARRSAHPSARILIPSPCYRVPVARVPWALAAALAALPLAARAQAGPPGADPVPALAAELRAIGPREAGERARTDPRLLDLDGPARARLLESLKEGPVWWAPVVNFFPGLGLGSLLSGDGRGGWLLGADLVGYVTVGTGLVMLVVSAAGSGDPEYDRMRSRAVGAMQVGAAVLVASRVAGVVLPFTFPGRRHRELERAFAEAPPRPRLGLFVAPLLPGSGAGGSAGLALAF